MEKQSQEALNESDSQNLANRLEACYSGAVFDVLRAMGYTQQVLPANIRPIKKSVKLAGPVFTVFGLYSQSLDSHQTLLAWTSLLSRAPAGSVVICQPNATDGKIALMGELSAEVLQYRGVRGYIVDGASRDSGFIERIGFKVFCTHFTPADVVGRWIPAVYAEPIVIGDVRICNGDFVMADRDGAVIIPQSVVSMVVERTEEVLRTENLVRTAILKGEDPKEAYLKYGKF
jgi:regulator of RNase E activity RraA